MSSQSSKVEVAVAPVALRRESISEAAKPIQVCIKQAENSFKSEVNDLVVAAEFSCEQIEEFLSTKIPSIMFVLKGQYAEILPHIKEFDKNLPVDKLSIAVATDLLMLMERVNLAYAHLQQLSENAHKQTIAASTEHAKKPLSVLYGHLKEINDDARLKVQQFFLLTLPGAAQNQKSKPVQYADIAGIPTAFADLFALTAMFEEPSTPAVSDEKSQPKADATAIERTASLSSSTNTSLPDNSVPTPVPVSSSNTSALPEVVVPAEPLVEEVSKPASQTTPIAVKPVTVAAGNIVKPQSSPVAADSKKKQLSTQPQTVVSNSNSAPPIAPPLPAAMPTSTPAKKGGLFGFGLMKFFDDEIQPPLATPPVATPPGTTVVTPKNSVPPAVDTSKPKAPVAAVSMKDELDAKLAAKPKDSSQGPKVTASKADPDKVAASEAKAKTKLKSGPGETQEDPDLAAKLGRRKTLTAPPKGLSAVSTTTSSSSSSTTAGPTVVSGSNDSAAGNNSGNEPSKNSLPTTPAAPKM